MNLALISPLANSYSETFIKAQKELLPFNIKFYFNGAFPKELENGTLKKKMGRLENFLFKVNRKFFGSELNQREQLLAKSIKTNNIDVVLAQYGPTGEAVWKVCNYLNIPLIVHFHGYDSNMPEVLEKYNNYRNVFIHAAKIVVVSKTMLNKMIALGCNPNKLVWHPCGPNDSFAKIKPEFTEKHFIGLGRFTDKKAPYYTILAFAKALEKFPDAKLTIGGDGALLNMCKNLVTHLGIDHAVCLPGVVRPEEYQNYLKTSLAFVQHSVIADDGDTEGTPVSVLEASAAGLAVISTKHAGIPDVIIDGETGLLVDEHDVHGMAAAMILLLENKELAMKLGAAGKENIKANFSMQQYINKLAEVIRQAVV